MRDARSYSDGCMIQQRHVALSGYNDGTDALSDHRRSQKA